MIRLVLDVVATGRRGTHHPRDRRRAGITQPGGDGIENPGTPSRVLHPCQWEDGHEREGYGTRVYSLLGECEFRGLVLGQSRSDKASLQEGREHADVCVSLSRSATGT